MMTPPAISSRMVPPQRKTTRIFWLLCAMGLALIVFNLLIDSKTWQRSIGLDDIEGLSPEREALFVLLAAPVFCFHLFSYKIGTAICWGCAAWWWLRREKRRIPGEVLILFLCNLYIVAQALPLLTLPDGMRIRAMGADPFVFLIAIGFTAFGLPGGAAGFCKDRAKAPFVARAFLSLTPVPLMFASLIVVNSIKGFVLR